MRILIFFLVSLSSFIVSAQTPGPSPHLGCLLHPKDLPIVGTRAVIAASQDKESLPDSMTIQADVEGEVSDSSALGQGTWEGFYRPHENGFYSVLPLPLFGFELNRDRHLIYICAHGDTDSKKNHFTVYLMRGFHIDPLHWGVIIGDLFAKPQLEVKPLSPVLLPLAKLEPKMDSLPGVLQLLELPVQLFGWQLTVASLAQRALSTLIGDISGLSIERIILTEDSMELASGVDLEHPEKARWKKTIDLRSLKKAAPSNQDAQQNQNILMKDSVLF